VNQLKDDGFQVMGFFYRHNIHPYTEMMRRQDTLTEWAKRIEFSVIYQDTYDLEGFLQNVVYRESDRCRLCYHDRIRNTALIAKKGKFDFFTTTLLYSKFQNHELIRSIGEAAGNSVGVPFYYEDFRKGWKFGIDESNRLGMYRQQYCGCIYSEKERYFKKKKNIVRHSG
jgi:predicted adenine nucleotide alpha hydrolase (AANH) superfamily ATPase